MGVLERGGEPLQPGNSGGGKMAEGQGILALVFSKALNASKGTIGSHS